MDQFDMAEIQWQFDRAKQNARVELPVEFPHKDRPSENDYVSPSIYEITDLKEVGEVINKAVSEFCDEFRATVATPWRKRDHRKVAKLYLQCSSVLETLNKLTMSRRGQYILPAIEKVIKTLYTGVRGETDVNGLILLNHALDIHLRYCAEYGSNSSHIVQWLEETIEGVLFKHHTRDFTPYAEFVDADDLEAAIKRNQEEDVVKGVLALIRGGDDDPYCEFLANYGYWGDLVVYYMEHDGRDGAETLIRNLISHEDMEIYPDTLGLLIRTYLGEEEYVRWLTDETKKGSRGEAEKLVRHPLVPYEDAVAAVEAAGFEDPVRREVLFTLYARHKETKKCLDLLKSSIGVASPGDILRLCEEQIAYRRPDTCLKYVKRLVRHLLKEQRYVEAAECLRRVRTMVLGSTEDLANFYQLLEEMKSMSLINPRLRRSLIASDLIPPDYDNPYNHDN